jgi:putative lipoprotein
LNWRSLIAEAGVRRRQIVAGGCVAMLVAASLAVGCGSDGDAPASGSGTADVRAYDSVLTGTITYITITYIQRVALPRDATVVVTLVDLSGGSGSKAVIAERRFEAAQQVPISFELPYDSSRIIGGHTYALWAQIMVDGALWFVNEQPQPVLTHGNSDSAQVLVRPAGAG